MARVTFQHARHMRAMGEKLHKTMRAVSLHGELIAKTDVLNQPGRGKPYVRVSGGVKRKGIASAPGDPPAPDTGGLRGSATSEAIRERDASVARTSINKQTALLLDQGTEKMAPRPFVEKIRNRMRRFFAKAARLYLS
jgi:hypothetical protein